MADPPDDFDDVSPDERGVSPGELDALRSAYALKDESRTGWVLRGVDEPESVAGHAWGVALLCLLFADRAGVDPARALRLAVVHDVGEAEVGDVPVRADAAESMDAAEKRAREREVVERYAAAFGDDFLDLWEEYERRESEAAVFVADMDLVDMVLQALVYERAGRYGGGDGAAVGRLDEFFRTAESDVGTDVGRALVEAIRRRYEAAKPERSERAGDVGGDSLDSGGDSPDSGGDSPDSGGDSPDSGGDSPDSGGDSTDTGGDSPDSGGGGGTALSDENHGE